MKKWLRRALWGALLLFPVSYSAPAQAWWPQGHSIIADAATRALPAEVPSWFRKGRGQIAHDAQDPDVQKSRDLPFMTEAEYSQHFIDFEMLQGRPLPPSRAEFYKLCQELKIDPFDVGEVPYAIAEWAQRLTMTFAEARQYPQNIYIHNKALVQAGILAHYAGDICMPLHVTMDHDGRSLPDGKSPMTGIHSRVDSVIEKLGLKPEALAQNQKIEAFPDLWVAVQAQLMESRTHIDRTYELESQFPPQKGDEWKPTPVITEWATERARTSTQFVSDLYLTAWHDSAHIKLPVWLIREKKK